MAQENSTKTNAVNSIHDHSAHQHDHTAHETHDHAGHDHSIHDHSADSGHDHAVQEHTGHDHSAHDGHETAQNTATMHEMHGEYTSHPAAHGSHAAHTGQNEHAGHGGHAGHIDHTGHEAMFRQRFWISLALTVPVVLYSPMIQQWLGFTMPQFPGSNWVSPLFAVAVFVIGGIPFLQMAVPEIQARKPGMMTLIAMAITVAFGYSLYAFLFPPVDAMGMVMTGGMDFFWEMATLIDIMLLGHWLEMRSVRQASGALNALAKLLPDTAERLSGEAVETVPVSHLRDGDLVLVRPGANIPADGLVVQGASSVSEALITGESKPVKKNEGDSVIGGTLNGDGSLRVRVTATGDKTVLAGIMRLVAEAQSSKSRAQVLADKAAGWLFYIALAAAILTAIGWTLATGFNLQTLERVVTVLVIACPHALGLAIPLVVSISTALGARNGILIRSRLALEAARNVDTVVFDKTGTLTEGRFGVAGMASVPEWGDDRALAWALAAEGDSEHPIAAGLREEAGRRNLTPPAVSAFEAIKGRGIKAQIEGKTVHVGGPRLLESLGLTPEGTVGAFVSEANSRGQTVVVLVVDNRIAAAFALADVIRPESKAAVDQLHAMNVRVVMLTGDSEAVAQSVAKQLGIDTVFAQVLPEHKDRKIAELQAQGHRVAMVGDGVNDAPALTRADVGIAVGSGTDVAVESAGIVLVRNDPRDVVRALNLSRATMRKMFENLLWATGYNVIALPLAAGVLAPIGIILSPAAGAVLMSVSTIVVAINAQLLRRAIA
jgi:P-type Cu2+ transporter